MSISNTKLFDDTIKILKKELGENLICAASYGTHNKKDKLICILEEMDFNVMTKIKSTLQPSCSKRIFSCQRLVMPLFFTKSELKDATDVFPLEFLDIMNPYEVLFGKDVIATIKIKKTAIRTQLEFELRSKLVHLRAGYLGTKSKSELCKLLKSAVPSLMPLFYGFIYLKDRKTPSDMDSLLSMIDKDYGLDFTILKKFSEEKIEASEIDGSVKELLDLLTKASKLVDKLNV